MQEESGNCVEIINPCTDYAFKRAFRNNAVAAGFLNNILNIPENEKIIEVHQLNPALASLHPLGKDFTVDFLCESVDKRRFLVEMQNDFRENYTTKAYIEFCRLMAHWDSETIRQEIDEESVSEMRHNSTCDSAKEFWKDISSAIVIVLTNQKLPSNIKKKWFPEHEVMEPEIINSYRMTHEIVQGRPLGDLDARVIIVMLDNFHKSETELNCPLDRWLYAFKDDNLSQGVKKIPTFKHILDADRVIGGDVALNTFYSILKKEVILKDGDLETFQRDLDQTNRTLAHAVARGDARARRDVALAMLRDNESDEKIIKYSKLTRDELGEIKTSL